MSSTAYEMRAACAAVACQATVRGSCGIERAEVVVAWLLLVALLLARRVEAEAAWCADSGRGGRGDGTACAGDGGGVVAADMAGTKTSLCVVFCAVYQVN